VTVALEKKLDITRALMCFLVSYCIVTVLATATTITYGMIYDSPQPEQLGVSLLKAPSFVATVPYHVVIMLLVWPIVAWVYFRKGWKENQDTSISETLRLALFWLVAAMIVDFLCFVLVKHPWSLSPYEFYVEYQPWIGLIYISIFLSPFVCMGLSRMLSKK
jgi:hypothetical protein